MEYIRFGRTDLKPSKLGFGCSRIASMSTMQPRSEVRATLEEAFDRGINFFDTADVYGQGDSERLLGALFQGRRDRVIFCTKVGMKLGVSQRVLRLAKPVLNPLLRRRRKGQRRVEGARQSRESESTCFDPSYLRSCVEGSLRRLRTDYIDLLLLHNPPVSVLQDARVFEMLAGLKESGSARYVGISCQSVKDARTCLEHGGLDALQVAANIADPEALSLLSELAGAECGAISRQPLAGGRLQGDASLALLCERYGFHDPLSLALQYMLERPDTGVVITGMTQRIHLRRNMAVFEEPSLHAEILNAVDPLT